jgi:RNA polymerase sigma factor (TIGR02999 family)
VTASDTTRPLTWSQPWGTLSVNSVEPRVTDENEDEISRVLKEVQRRAPGSDARLFTVVYQELRRIARSLMRHERPGHTLQTTALVHEAYIRLFRGHPEWQSRSHFLAVSCGVMRQILIDHARRNKAARRGGAPVRVEMLTVCWWPMTRLRVFSP